MPSTLDSDNEFITWLQNELDKRGWTKQHLADEAGVHGAVIIRIMNRNVGLGIDVAKKIAAALGVGQYEVYRRAGLIDDAMLDDDKAAAEYLRLLSAIEDDDERQAVIDTVETILRRVAERTKAKRADASGRVAGVKGKA